VDPQFILKSESTNNLLGPLEHTLDYFSLHTCKTDREKYLTKSLCQDDFQENNLNRNGVARSQTIRAKLIEVWVHKLTNRNILYYNIIDLNNLIFN